MYWWLRDPFFCILGNHGNPLVKRVNNIVADIVTLIIVYCWLPTQIFILNTQCFFRVISNCIQLLVQDLENACEPALTAMSKVSFVLTSTVNLSVIVLRFMTDPVAERGHGGRPKSLHHGHHDPHQDHSTRNTRQIISLAQILHSVLYKIRQFLHSEVYPKYLQVQTDQYRGR